MDLPFDFREELEKLRELELKALKADNAVLRQRCKIFPPVEEECKKALSAIDKMKNEAIVEAVKRTGSIAGAAQELGMGRSTIHKRINQFGIAICIPILMLLSVFSSNAQTQVKIQWDPSPSPGVEYRLYAATNSISETNKLASPIIVGAGTNLTATLDQVVPNTYYVRATAYYPSNGVESVLSDQLVFSIPHPPASLYNVYLQWTQDVTSTNWITFTNGFFRIKFGDN